MGVDSKMRCNTCQSVRSADVPQSFGLQPEGRVTLADLRQQNYSVRAIARQLQHWPVAIGRELQRNSHPCGYGGVPAQCLTLQRRRADRLAIKLQRHEKADP